MQLVQIRLPACLVMKRPIRKFKMLFQSQGVAPHGVMSDWAAGREQEGQGGAVSMDSSSEDENIGSSVDKKGSQGNENGKSHRDQDSSTNSKHTGSDESDVDNLGEKVGGNQNGKTGKSMDGASQGLQSSMNEDDFDGNVKSSMNDENKGGDSSDEKEATLQDDRVPTSDITGILTASSSDVSDNMMKDRIETLKGKLAYREGLPKLGDVPDDPYPPLNDIPHNRGAVGSKRRNYGNRTDGKWTLDVKTGYWVKSSAADINIEQQSDDRSDIPLLHQEQKNAVSLFLCAADRHQHSQTQRQWHAQGDFEMELHLFLRLRVSQSRLRKNKDYTGACCSNKIKKIVVAKLHFSRFPPHAT